MSALTFIPASFLAALVILRVRDRIRTRIDGRRWRAILELAR